MTEREWQDEWGRRLAPKGVTVPENRTDNNSGVEQMNRALIARLIAARCATIAARPESWP